MFGADKSINYKIQVGVVGDQHLQRFQRQVDSLSKSSRQSAKALTEMSTRNAEITRFAKVAGAALGTLIGTVFSVSFAFRSLSQAMARVDDQAKTSRSFDGSVTSLRALELAAGDVGVEVTEVRTAMQSLTREVSKVNLGLSKNGKYFQQLGLDVAALGKMDADERLATIADAIQKAGLSSGEASALLQKLGIRGREMGLLLSQGGDSIRAARDEIVAFGGALSDDAVTAIEDANDAISRIGLGFSILGDRMAAELAPTLKTMADRFTTMIKEGGALRPILDSLVAGFVNFVETLNYSLRNIEAFIISIRNSETAISLLKGTVVIAAGVIGRALIGLAMSNPFTALALAAVAAVSLIIANWQILALWFTTRLPAILAGVVVEWHTLRGNILLALKPLVEGVASIFDSIANIIIRVINDLKVRIGGLASSVAGIAESLGAEAISAKMAGFASSLKAPIEEMNSAGTAAGFMTEMIDGVVRSTEIAQGVVNSYQGQYEAGLKVLEDAAKGAKNELDGATNSVTDLTDALTDAGGGGGGGGAAKASAALQYLRSTIEGMRTPMEVARDELAKLRAAIAEVGEANIGAEGIDKLRKKMAELVVASSELGTKLKELAEGGLNTFFSDILEGTKSVKQAFGDMVREMISQVAKFMFNKIVQQFFSNLLGGLAGGGGILGGLGSLFGAPPAAAALGAAPPVAGPFAISPMPAPALGPRLVISNPTPRVGADRVGSGSQTPVEMKVTVVNNTGEKFEAQSTYDPSNRETTITLRKEVEAMIRRGDMDAAMGQRFTARRRYT